MVTEELLRYVEYQKNRGVDKNSIKMTLLQAGWTGDDINEAFGVVDTVASENDTSDNLASDQSRTGSAEVGDNSDNSATGNKKSADDSTADTSGPDSNDKSNATQSGVQSSTGSNAAENLQQLRQKLQQSTINQGDNITLNDTGNNTDSVTRVEGLNQNRDNKSQTNRTNQAPATEQGKQPEQFNTSPVQRSAAATPIDVLGSPNTAEPKSASNIKYRRAADWQLNKSTDDNSSLGKGEEPGQSPNKLVSAASADKKRALSDSRESNDQMRIQPEQNKPTQTENSGLVYRPSVKGNTMKQSARLPRQSLNANPKAKLQSQSTDKSKNKKITILVIAILLLVALAAAAATFLPRLIGTTPDYSPDQIISAFDTVQYVSYAASGELPLNINNPTADTPPAVAAVANSTTLPINVRGLVNTQSNKNGFSASLGEITLDFAYDGSRSFAKFRELPNVSPLDQVPNEWFEIKGDGDVSSVLSLLSGNPPTNLSDVVNAVSSSLTDLYNSDVLQFEYKNTIDGASGAVDMFDFSFDVDSFNSRIPQNTAFFNDMFDYSGLLSVEGQAQIDRNTRLIQEVDAQLIHQSGASNINISFDYDYTGSAITAPPNVVPSDEIISILQQLGPGEEVVIMDRLRLLGSDASVYRDNEGSFNNFCASDAVQELRDFVSTNTGVQATCNAANSEFLVQLPLPNPDFFGCIDSNYSAVVTQTAVGTEATSCGPSVVYIRTDDGSDLSTEASESDISDDDFFD